MAQSRGLVPQNLSQSHKTRPMGYGKVLLFFFSQGTCSVLLKSFSPGASGGVVLVLRASRCPGLWWPLMFQTCYRGNRDLP